MLGTEVNEEVHVIVLFVSKKEAKIVDGVVRVESLTKDVILPERPLKMETIDFCQHIKVYDSGEEVRPPVGVLPLSRVEVEWMEGEHVTVRAVIVAGDFRQGRGVRKTRRKESIFKCFPFLFRFKEMEDSEEDVVGDPIV